MRDSLCNDVVPEEDVRSSDGVHTDFQSFVEQDIAGKQIRIHSGYMKYLVNDNRGEIAILALYRKMNTPCADAVELSLCRVDFHGFIEGFVVDQNMSVRREVLRGTRIEDPMFWIAALTVVSIDLCRCSERYSGFRCCGL